MVTLSQATSSNKRTASTFPNGLVAVFIGGTSGVGEYTVKAFAKYVTKPRIYIIGRSRQAADLIIKECEQINSEGNFEFMQADVSLLNSVDEVCRQIKSKETAINILFQSQGSMGFSKTTSEGLPFATALALHSRTRFILNLLPLLRNSRHLRRVVSVGAASFEGEIDLANMSNVGQPLMKWRDQLASCLTLLLKKVAQGASDVSFIHTCPGVVKSGIMRDMEPTLRLRIMVAITGLLAPIINTSAHECGERHVFVATSARYARSENGVASLGVPIERSLVLAREINGEKGSGIYSLNVKCESSSEKVEQVLKHHEESGAAEKVWQYILDDYLKITGSERLQ